jgi:hypothetical protein
MALLAAVYPDVSCWPNAIPTGRQQGSLVRSLCGMDKARSVDGRCSRRQMILFPLEFKLQAFGSYKGPS